VRQNNHGAGQKIHLGNPCPEFPGIASQESHHKGKRHAMSGSSVIGVSIPLEKEAKKNVNVRQICKNRYEENICPTGGNGIIFETNILDSEPNSSMAQR
jgi:hypothetical protein